MGRVRNDPPAPWPERLRQTMEGLAYWPERIAAPPTAMDPPRDSMTVSKERTVSECFWNKVFDLTGLNPDKIVATTKHHTPEEVKERTHETVGDFDPARLAHFANCIAVKCNVKKAAGELSRRLRNDPSCAVTGHDLEQLESEADLEAGWAGRKKGQGRVSDPETRSQLMQLKKHFLKFVKSKGSSAELDEAGVSWANHAGVESLYTAFETYADVLKRYRDVLAARAQYKHGVHDYNENKKYQILREREREARRAVEVRKVRNHFTSLNFSTSKISRIDDEMTEFASLAELTLTGNCLTVLENLPKSLVVLHACGNRIAEIRPNTLTNNLVHLGLAFNRFTDLHFIGECHSSLQGLMSLDVGYNLIHDMEHAIDSCLHLPCLKRLYLEGNPCSLLPFYRQHTLRELPLIQVLDDVQVTEEERAAVGAMEERIFTPQEELDKLDFVEAAESQKEEETKEPPPPAPEGKKGGKKPPAAKPPPTTPAEEKEAPPPKQPSGITTFTLSLTIESIKGLDPDPTLSRGEEVVEKGKTGKPPAKPPPKAKGGKGPEEAETVQKRKVLILIEAQDEFPFKDSEGKSIRFAVEVNKADSQSATDGTASKVSLPVDYTLQLTLRPEAAVGEWLSTPLPLSLYQVTETEVVTGTSGEGDQGTSVRTKRFMGRVYLMLSDALSSAEYSLSRGEDDAIHESSSSISRVGTPGQVQGAQPGVHRFLSPIVLPPQPHTTQLVPNTYWQLDLKRAVSKKRAMYAASVAAVVTAVLADCEVEVNRATSPTPPDSQGSRPVSSASIRPPERERRPSGKKLAATPPPASTTDSLRSALAEEEYRNVQLLELEAATSVAEVEVVYSIAVNPHLLPTKAPSPAEEDTKGKKGKKK